MEDKRIVVTLTNGRSHVIDLPATVSSSEASALLRGVAGEPSTWPDGTDDWLSFGNGQGWLRRDAIAEITLVDSIPDEQQIFD